MRMVRFEAEVLVSDEGKSALLRELGHTLLTDVKAVVKGHKDSDAELYDWNIEAEEYIEGDME